MNRALLYRGMTTENFIFMRQPDKTVREGSGTTCCRPAAEASVTSSSRWTEQFRAVAEQHSGTSLMDRSASATNNARLKPPVALA